ncbi:MAG: hypothetical protein WBP22_00110 [Candidatus Saccharimonas sp.]
MKRIYAWGVVGVVVVSAVIAGFLVPLGSYTTVNGCSTENMPVQRLSMMRGESLDTARERDVVPGPTEGCAIQTKYVLYFF